MSKVDIASGAGTKARILDAAEKLFSLAGYDAASLRDIAAAADTRTGLVSYHFGSKEALYETIIERRSAEIGARRLRALSDEKRRAGAAGIAFDRAIHAYVWPFLDFAHNGSEQWKNYTKIISSVANSQRWTHLLSAYYDPVAGVFLNEFERQLPSVERDDIVAAFTFMVNIMLGAAAETGRAELLSQGTIRSSDTDRIFGVMLPFLTAGFRALAGPGR